MYKRICFVEIKRNEYGLYEGVQGPKTASIRAFLKANGVESSIYAEKSLSSINDTVDEIIALSDEMVVFVINENAIDINAVLIELIADVGVDEIYAIDSYSKKCDKNADYIFENPEEKLLALSGFTGEERTGIREVSPYREGTILARDILLNGIWLGDEGIKRSREVIADELEILKEIYAGDDAADGRALHFTGKAPDTKEDVLGIAEMVKERNVPGIVYCIPADINALSKEYTEDAYENIKFCIRISDEPTNKETEFLRSLLEKDRTYEVILKTELINKGSETGNILAEAIKSGKRFSLKLYGCADPENIEKSILDRAMDATRRYYSSYYKGHLKSRLGLYADVRTDGKVHHLMLDGEADDSYKIPFEVEYFNELMSVNSSVLVKGKERVRGQMEFDADGVAHEYCSDYKEFMNNAVEEMRNPSNLVISAGNKIYVNDLACGDEICLERMTYSQASKNIEVLKNRTEDNVMTLIRLDSREDLEMLKKDAEKFRENKGVGDLPLAYGLLENACRFLGKGQCGVERIPRLYCTADGSVSPCESCSELYGKESSAFDITRRCYASHEKNASQAGCYECMAKEACAGCSELPSFMKQEYCEIMRNKRYVLDYICLPHYLGRLKESIVGFGNIDNRKIRISNENMQYLVAETSDKNNEPYLYDFTSCVMVDEKYVLWSPVKNSFYGINKAFAIYIELLLERCKKENIVAEFSGYVGITENEADKMIAKMNRLLQSAGIFRNMPKANEKTGVN